MAHLRKHGPSWYAIYRVPGRKNPVWERLSRDEEEAKRMFAELVEEQRTGVSKRKTLAAYLQEWLEMYAKVSVRPTTYDSYEMLVRQHFTPYFGNKQQLRALTPMDLQQYMATKLKGGLSPTTVRYHYRILKGALQTAVDQGYMAKNPALGAKPPQRQEKEQDVWEIEEAVKFLAGIRDHRLYALYATALLTGLRRGELLGLTWPHVNFTTMMLRIHQTVLYADNKILVQPAPKTKQGRRNVAFGPGLAAILKEHKAKAKVNSPYVFHNRKGGPIDPHNLSGKQFPKLCENTGVRRIPFHNLRHTHLTELVAAGVHLRVVSDRAGHSSTDFTANTYAHVLPSMQRGAAEVSESRLLSQLEAFANRLQGRGFSDVPDTTETPS